jgi:putative membrane protein
MGLIMLFLVSYILHHLFAGRNHVWRYRRHPLRVLQYLATHIVLAAVILPFILFTAYRALIGENEAHRKLAKKTWPVWFYVAVTGPVVYALISPYYQ